jgi:hypothetical protein
MDSHLDAVLGRNVSCGRHGQDESDLPVSYWHRHVLDVTELATPPHANVQSSGRRVPDKDLLTGHAAILDGNGTGASIRRLLLL